MSVIKNIIILFVILTFLSWYFHEYHTASFMQITRNIPYLSTIMIELHSYIRVLYPTKITESTHETLFTVDELSQFDGENNSKGLYISILGKVYDVEKGRQHYGPGSGYHVFAGRDASKAFISGDFTESGATDDIITLTPKELLSLKEWSTFYDKEYVYKGKLIGRFYQSNGDITDYFVSVEEKMNLGEIEKQSELDDKLNYPPCNSEWNRESGSKVWCTTQSGGIERKWAGVPRKLFEVGSDSFRCACINLKHLEDPNSPVYAKKGLLQLYDGCQPRDRTCKTG